MEDCIFCKIASGEISTNKVFEDDKMVAILDIHPLAPGHTLLIPKDHYRWFQDLPDDISDDLFRRAKQITKQIKADAGADYVRLSIVGLHVPHVHIHLIPRFANDKPIAD